jgi:L-amino acid N-acyltransferase YncA
MSAEANTVIRPMQPGDWPDVRAIYTAGIATGHATFETAPPIWAEWDVAHFPGLRFVAVDGIEVVGWAAACPVSDRCSLAGVAESSVYVDPLHQGAGVGRLLLTTLIETSEQAGIWTVQAGVFPENTASLALHVASGFRVVGKRERLGQLDGQWRDVILLERRSR